MDKLLQAQVEEIINGYSKNPHAILGMHFEDDTTIIRCFNPNSVSIAVKDVHTSKSYDMKVIDKRGLFECRIPGNTEPFLYELVHTTKDKHTYSVIDPTHFYLLYQTTILTFLIRVIITVSMKPGCYLREVNGVKGASFAVWAPMAQRVSVVGSFNQWDGRTHQCMLGSSGVWELFIPTKWKAIFINTRLRPPQEKYIKSDPMPLCGKTPQTASVVYDNSKYTWNDEDWLTRRAEENIFDKPVNIYEVHLGSWMQEPDPDPESETGLKPFSYRKLAETLVPYVKDGLYPY